MLLLGPDEHLCSSCCEEEPADEGGCHEVIAEPCGDFKCVVWTGNEFEKGTLGDLANFRSLGPKVRENEVRDKVGDFTPVEKSSAEEVGSFRSWGVEGMEHEVCHSCSKSPVVD